MDLSVFSSQRKFIQSIIKRHLVLPAIIIGIIGEYSLPLVSFLARLFLNKLANNEIFQMLIDAPIKSIIFFFVSVGFVYLVGRIFKGEKKFTEYLIASGFGGIYVILTSFTLIPIAFAAKFTDPSHPNQIVALIAVFCALSGLIAAIYAIKYEVICISEVFRFKVFKSIIIWLITLLPLFFIKSSIWKIN